MDFGLDWEEPLEDNGRRKRKQPRATPQKLLLDVWTRRITDWYGNFYPAGPQDDILATMHSRRGVKPVDVADVLDRAIAIVQRSNKYQQYRPGHEKVLTYSKAWEIASQEQVPEEEKRKTLQGLIEDYRRKWGDRCFEVAGAATGAIMSKFFEDVLQTNIPDNISDDWAAVLALQCRAGLLRGNETILKKKALRWFQEGGGNWDWLMSDPRLAGAVVPVSVRREGDIEIRQYRGREECLAAQILSWKDLKGITVQEDDKVVHRYCPEIVMDAANWRRLLLINVNG